VTIKSNEDFHFYDSQDQKTFNDLSKARAGKKVVFTNGCFDLLHIGHVSYLNEAKSLGDLLVVALDTDKSVQNLKGPLRPIICENERRFVLSNLKAVDFVFLFENSDPRNLIKKISPDYLVKGGDWAIDKILGSKEVLASGGSVQSLKFIDQKSTTGIIEKILIAYRE